MVSTVRRMSVVAASLLLVPWSLAAPASAQQSGSVTGVAFTDDDRDGVRDVGEPPRPGDLVYLLDETGRAVAGAYTDASGTYRFDGVPAGRWRVAYAATSWWPIREALVPTTTGSLRPSVAVEVVGADVRADFGWRPIVRSTTAGAPISAHTGPEGLKVESYNDVVPAAEIHRAVLAGTVRAEARHVVVRFALGTSSTTTTVVGASRGVYDRFAATAYVAYDTWLNGGDRVLSHEYGHAWSLYHAYLTQQDPTLAGYVEARGLTGDPRLNSSHAWAAREMVAEDYRQLLGAPSAAAGQSQANRDVPLAAEVSGLAEYLSTTFVTAAGNAGNEPDASPGAGAAPPPEPTVSPSPEPTAEPSPTPTTAKRKGGGACKRSC